MTVSLLGCIADDYTGATDLSSMLVRAGLRVKFLHKRGVTKIIVAGGETSGSVINALDIKTVRIGAEIAPGVPWITTLDEPIETHEK